MLSLSPHYDNETPITDPKAALPLLASRSGGRWAGAYLHDGYYNGGEAYIEIHYEGREYSSGSSRRYRVDSVCAKEIITNRWVKGVPMYGYTDHHKLTISRHGNEQLTQWNEEEKQEARSLLKVGEHGWSSIYNYHGKHYLRRGESKDWPNGHLFSNPVGERFMVFLSDKRVERVKMEECL